MSRRLLLFALISILTLFTGIAGSAAAQGTPSSGGAIPDNLAPPAPATMLFALHSSGVQIYACETDPDDATKYVWTFKAPEADLFNSRGELVGTHFAGPTWQGMDGSAVAAAVLERADAPDTGAIPWLLLEANEHSGDGVFSTASYIQRLDTVGGVAPAEGCDEAHEGDETRVPYEATYAFFFPVAEMATPAA